MCLGETSARGAADVKQATQHGLSLRQLRQGQATDQARQSGRVKEGEKVQQQQYQQQHGERLRAPIKQCPEFRLIPADSHPFGLPVDAPRGE